jgi:hypothetical protein
MITVFLSHLILTLASLLSPEVPAPNTKIPDGHYRGAEFLIRIIMRVSGDTAFVDFLAVDKYPREIQVDTLYYNPALASWTGKYTVLVQERKKYYIRSNGQCPERIFGRKPNFRMKSEEQFYGSKVDPRNCAMINAYYTEFLKKHNSYEKRILYYQTQYMLNKRTAHSIYRQRFESFRTELEEKVAAVKD